MGQIRGTSRESVIYEGKSIAFSGHPFRQNAVLPCSPLFRRLNKNSALSGRVYLLSSPTFARNCERCSWFLPWAWLTILSETTMAGKLKPPDVARLVTSGKYPDVKSCILWSPDMV